MRRKTLVVGGAVGVAAAASLAASLACSAQLNDMEGIPQASPDYVITVLNVDGFPNMTMLCFDGVGFATTTRDYASLTKVPEWDAICAAKMPASPRVVGTIGKNGGN